MQAHSVIKEFICTICGYEYADKRNLKFHHQRVHPEEAEGLECTVRLQCDICPNNFQHKRDLEVHKVNNNNENYFFTCVYGEELIKTNFENVISIHRRHCQNIDSYMMCKVCEKTVHKETRL